MAISKRTFDVVVGANLPGELGKYTCMLLLIALTSACGDSLNDSQIETKQVCSLVQAAFSSHDYSGLLSELERQLHIDRSKMKIAKDGVFIPTRTFFVEEKGYFVSRAPIDEAKRSDDPSFYWVKDCVCRYEIKG